MGGQREGGLAAGRAAGRGYGAAQLAQQMERGRHWMYTFQPSLTTACGLGGGRSSRRLPSGQRNLAGPCSRSRFAWSACSFAAAPCS